MPEPKYIVADTNTMEWQAVPGSAGIEVKRLGSANGQAMELSRYAPDTAYPAHAHLGPEFVFLLEGSARLSGQWLKPGWSSIGETGTIDADFLSGESGCVFLAIYTASQE
jgi:hypothetical protein